MLWMWKKNHRAMSTESFTLPALLSLCLVRQQRGRLKEKTGNLISLMGIILLIYSSYLFVYCLIQGLPAPASLWLLDLQLVLRASPQCSHSVYYSLHPSRLFPLPSPIPPSLSLYLFQFISNSPQGCLCPSLLRCESLSLSLSLSTCPFLHLTSSPRKSFSLHVCLCNCVFVCLCVFVSFNLVLYSSIFISHRVFILFSLPWVNLLFPFFHSLSFLFMSVISSPCPTFSLCANFSSVLYE